MKTAMFVSIGIFRNAVRRGLGGGSGLGAVFLIGANTLRETLRQKLVLIVALVALGLVAASKYLLSLDLGHEKIKFVFDFASGALGFFGSIMAVAATCRTFHDEFENRTIITVFSKPVGAFRFAAGKIAGICFALGIFAFATAAAACAMLALTAAGAGEGAPRVNYAGVFAFALAAWAKLCAVAAVSGFICSASTSFLFSAVASFLALAVSAAGEITFRLGGSPDSFAVAASWIFPDFRVFAPAEAFAFAPVEALKLLAMCAYGAVYTLAASAAGAVFLSKREF